MGETKYREIYIFFVVTIVSIYISLFIVTNKLYGELNTVKQIITNTTPIKNEYLDGHSVESSMICDLKFDNIKDNIIDKVFTTLSKGCSKEFLPKISIYTLYLYMAGSYYNVNPSLLADIMILESRCNNNAINKDSGAFGLMQIHPVHNVYLYSNDFENILKGSEILRDCYNRYGTVVGALECYGRGFYSEDRIVYAGTKLLSAKYKNID